MPDIDYNQSFFVAFDPHNPFSAVVMMDMLMMMASVPLFVDLMRDLVTICSMRRSSEYLEIVLV